MKKYFLLLTLALASCTQIIEEQNPVMENDGLRAFTITAKSTKTTLQNDLSVIWNAGDSICVFDNLGCHPFVTSETGASAEFIGIASADNEPKLMLYPYDKYASAQLETSEIKTFIPGIQTGRIGSFGEANNISVGIVENNAFYARNVCGLIKLTLNRSDLASVEIISLDAGNKIAGWVEINNPGTNPAAALVSEGSNSVSLKASEGTLASGVYYLDAIPCVLSEGYCIRTTTPSGHSASKVFSSSKTIERSGITDFGTVDSSYDSGYLCLDVKFYDTAKGKLNQPFTEDLPANRSYAGQDKAYTLSYGGKNYTFKLRSENGFCLTDYNAFNGLKMGDGESNNACIKLPGIAGKVLKKITLLSGTTMSNKKEIRITTSEHPYTGSMLNIFLGGGTNPEEKTFCVPGAESGVSYALYFPSGTSVNPVLANLKLEYENPGPEDAPAPYFVKAKEKGETVWTRCYETMTVESIPGFCPTGEPELDEYGGWKGVFTFPATNRFYCAQYNGRWWMVDPLGNPFFSKGICSFRLDLDSQIAKDAYAEKYNSDKESWAKGEWALLKEYGFNSFGGFSSFANIKSYLRVPYTVLISPTSAYLTSIKAEYIEEYGEECWTSDGPFGFPMVFDEGFAAQVETTAKSTLPTYKDDPYVMGIMTDNEWPVNNTFLKICLEWPNKQHVNYTTAQKWLSDNGITAETALASDIWKKKFAAYCFQTYLQIINAAVKKYAPTQMYLGCKLTGNNQGLANEYAFQAAKGLVDAMSIDLYHTWTPDVASMRSMAENCGAPVILAEWYVKGEDTDPQDELKNTSGVGYTVPTQKERGYFYQNYVIGGIRSGVVVGCHWFRYMDNDPGSGASTSSNYDANKGVVTRRLTPYYDILEEMYKVNSQIYALCQYYN